MNSAAVEAAVERIVARRRGIDDPHLDEFIAAAHDAGELIDVVLRRHRGLPNDVGQAELEDAVLLHAYRWWQWAGQDLALLERAEQAGANRRRIGAPLRVSTGQGLVDRIRTRRRQLAQARGEPDPAELAAGDERLPARQRWLSEHHDELQAAREQLLQVADVADDEVYAQLRELAGEPWTPATMTLLGLAVAELHASPQVRELSEEHPVQVVITRWSQLFEHYRQTSN